MSRAQRDKPELPVTLLLRQVNPAERFLHNPGFFGPDIDHVKTESIPLPFTFLHIQRRQHIVPPKRPTFVIGYYRPHGLCPIHTITGGLKGLPHGIRPSENLPGQTFCQNHMPGHGQCLFRVTGQYRKPQSTHHPRRSSQATGSKIVLFPTGRIHLDTRCHPYHSYFSFSLQQTVHLHSHIVNDTDCPTGRIIILHQIQVLVTRTEVIVVRFRPQPVQAERQAHDAHGQSHGRNPSLPTVAAQITQGLFQVLHPQTYCSHSFKLFPWFHSSHANSSTSP